MQRYCYDLHTHTAPVSPCGRLSVRELIAQYRALRYDGIVLTDHFRTDFWNGEGDWNACAERFLAPWREGCALALEGFWVGRGMEIRFYDSPNDFLLYGWSTELFLAEGHNWLTMGLENFFAQYHEQMLIIQAHPNRWDSTHPADRRWLHGVEVYNTNPRHDSHNEVTMAWVKETTGLILTAGSDSHCTEDVGRTGILTDRPLRSEAELAALLCAGNYRLLMEGGSHALP